MADTTSIEHNSHAGDRKIPGWFLWLMGLLLPAALLMGGYVWYRHYQFSKNAVVFYKDTDRLNVQKCVAVLEAAGIQTDISTDLIHIRNPGGALTGKKYIKQEIWIASILPKQFHPSLIALAREGVLLPVYENCYSDKMEDKALAIRPRSLRLSIFNSVLKRDRKKLLEKCPEIDSAEINMSGSDHRKPLFGDFIPHKAQVRLRMNEGDALNQNFARMVSLLLSYTWWKLPPESVTVSDQYGNVFRGGVRGEGNADVSEIPQKSVSAPSAAPSVK